MVKKIVVACIIALLTIWLYLLAVDTPPSQSNKANQRSGHVLACMKLTCPTEGQQCSPDIVKACTDSAFNIYHDPTWGGERSTINVIPSAIQEPVR